MAFKIRFIAACSALPVVTIQLNKVLPRSSDFRNAYGMFGVPSPCLPSVSGYWMCFMQKKEKKKKKKNKFYTL